MTEFLFYLAQLCGVGGMLTMVVSFQSKQKKRLLKIQIFSCLFYIAQYLCLGAWSGCLVKLVALTRDILYTRFKDAPFYLVILVLLAIWTVSIFTYNGPLSLLPCLGTSILTIGLACKDPIALRLLDILACLVYIIYNCIVGAYSGALATSLELISSFIAILRFRLTPNISSRKNPHSSSRQKSASPLHKTTRSTSRRHSRPVSNRTSATRRR